MCLLVYILDTKKEKESIIMKKSTIFAFAAGLAAGVLFNDRIRKKLSRTKESIVSRFQAAVNQKTAEILHEKIDSVFGPKPEEKEEAKQEQSTQDPYAGHDVTFTVQSLSSLSTVVRNAYDTIDMYGCMSIANLYDIAGIRCGYTDQYYGWNSTKDFRISDIVENADHTFTVTVSGARRL